jgi:aminoglycoside 3-N-acetyltransferase
MPLSSGRLPVPPVVEFLARCAAAARRRYLPGRRRGTATRATPAPVEPVGADRLRSTLQALGIRPGGVLMVHSGAPAVHRLGWEPSDLIDFLLEYLGPEGTLAMPTHPKLALREGRLTYDVRRSPSQVGLLTELFRRRRSTLRSRCPIAAAAAMGARAQELTEGHARSWAPHDENSPYGRLAELEGQALCIGVPLNRMTILHVAEDSLRDSLPIANFHEEREVWVVADGEATAVRVHMRSPWLWWYLNLGRWSYQMHRRGLARSRTLAEVPLYAANADDVVQWMKNDIRQGRSIYPLASMNRWLGLGDPGFGLGQEG